MRIFLRRAFLAVGIAALWATSSFAAYPTARTSARMAFDDSIGRIVLFGGISGPDASGLRYEMNDTWEWNGSNWVRKYPADSPEKRSGFAFNYFPPLAGTVLFGGVDNTTVLDDTWIYRRGNWEQLSPAASPSPRAFAATAVDPATNRLVLYGGSNTTDFFYDTWQFDGTTWTKTLDSGPSIKNPLAVYDQARGQLLLLGWNSSNATEMYRWDGSAWVIMTPANRPACIRQGVLAYEAKTQKVLYVGGGCADGSSAEDTWQWDGSDWSKVTLEKETDGTTVTQDVVSGHSMAYDKVRGKTVLFGGDDVDVRNRTIVYSDAKWVRIQDHVSPGPMTLFVFENDPATAVSWLFGGHNEEGQNDELWKLTGNTWQYVAAENTPSACFNAVGSFDTDRGRLVVVCDDSKTYEWDGAQWYSFPSLKDTPPASRKFSSMLYDPAIKKSVLFGGYLDVLYSKETWLWDGTTWTRTAKDGDVPTNRSNAAMFYDPSQQKVFLFGGIGRPTGDDKIVRLSDMWSFDGTKWTQLKNLTTKPSARYGMQTRYDESAGRTIMFGGKDENEKYLNEQWEWNGTAWSKAEPASPPSARMNGQMLYDKASQRLLLFGGYAGFYYSELWQNVAGQWSIVREPAGRPRPFRPISSSGKSGTAVSGARAGGPAREEPPLHPQKSERRRAERE